MPNREDIGHLLLGQPELTEQLMRALDIKGDAPRLIEGTYSGQVIAENLTRPEFDYLRRTNRFARGRRVAPVAAQFSQIAFGYPTTFTGRALVLLDTVVIQNNNAAAVLTVNFGFGPVGAITPDAAFPGLASDDRLLVAQSLACIGVGANAASPLPTTAEVTLPASTVLVLNLPFILTNNRPAALTQQPFYIVGGATNIGFGANFYWRERVILSSEL